METRTVSSIRLLWSVLLVWSAIGSPLLGQDPRLIAPTDPLSPAQQQKKFHLPPGFEIQLVVSEPAIGQPMNLNFDAAGRLWITSSIEYPYPTRGKGVQPREARFGTASNHAPRDSVAIVSGIDAGGKGRRVSKFVSGLNIPLGITPVKNGAVVYSIPSIELMQDTNGDGKADKRKTLFTGFGNIDTHGMTNSFTRWIDGWIYACHGFNNTSNVQSNGRAWFTMNSGNTYRFREDGSRIEQMTWGQVNPFGLTFDPLGNAYTADCHSKPLTLLLRGASYSSFGKPHDGLGYGPDMIDHTHGSTGICGPAYYAASQFPDDYQQSMFLCNPVTGRVHRDKLIDHGSTRLVDTQPDFITCDDPWFRPVDAQVGPDGCLYIADFYNAIIGHYEVPLPHPKRDRSKGRVWRVVYRGKDRSIPPPKVPDLTKLSQDDLLARLNDDNLIVRLLATNLVVDKFGAEAVQATRRLVLGESSPKQRAHGVWILARLDAFDEPLVERLAADVSPLVRVHVVRSLAERQDWSDKLFAIARGMLTEADAFVRRAAADAVGRHPHLGNIKPLLFLLVNTPADDTHLRHTVRIALRDQLRQESVAKTVGALKLADREQRALASVCLAVPTEQAGSILATHLRSVAEDGPQFRQYLQHISRYGTAETLASVVNSSRKRFADDVDSQYQHLLAIRTGLERRGVGTDKTIRNWASTLAMQLLSADSNESLEWTPSPLPGRARTAAPWKSETRRCADGNEGLFFSTLPSGEQVTGIYRSAAFALPAKLSFFVAGHRGPPQQAHEKNLVRLRDAKTGAVLAETLAPRNDTAQKVEWNLARHAGRQASVELVDGDTATGYAWLAVGRFSEKRLNATTFARGQAAATLVNRYQLRELQPQLEKIVLDSTNALSRRVAAAGALAGLQGDARLRALTPVASRPATDNRLREQIFKTLSTHDETQVVKILAEVMRSLPGSQQTVLSETLASDRAGSEALLALVEQGVASPRLLLRPAISRQLTAAKPKDAAIRVARLTKGLLSLSEAVAKRIVAHRQGFANATLSRERGLAMFKKHCAACHRIGKEGTIIGPQLDGIGIRGLDRLLEDLLDPNQNVDAAFRITTIVTADGKVRNGLFRRAAGNTLIFADDKGKEFTLTKDAIDTQVKSPLSLMPANLHELLKPAELNDLLGYLLEQRHRAAPQSSDR